MITGFFVYGFVEFLGWFNTEVEQDLLQEPENAGRLVFVGIAAPVLALAGGAMAHPRPAIGGGPAGGFGSGHAVGLWRRCFHDVPHCADGACGCVCVAGAGDAGARDALGDL